MHENDVLCASCKTKSQRNFKYLSRNRDASADAPPASLEACIDNLRSESKGLLAWSCSSKATAIASALKEESEKVNEAVGEMEASAGSRAAIAWKMSDGAVEAAGTGADWKFKCKCGETCSSYENPRYYPKGRLFECDR